MRSSGAVFGSLVIGVLAVSGCAVVAPYREPIMPTPVAFGTTVPTLRSEPVTDSVWWEEFDDPVLTELIAQALSANRDLRAGIARVAMARARSSQVGAERLPTGGVAASRDRGEASDYQGLGRIDGHYAGFDTSWELDLFGRIDNAARAADAQFGAAEATLADLELTIAAEVARDYFELRGARDRIGLLQGFIADQQTVVDLTLARLENGAASEEDSSRARAQLAADRAALLQELDRAQRLQNALAVLLGRTPGDWDLPAESALGALRLETITIGEPADLLRRRPDIRAAERRLTAAHADVAAAVAGLFPRVRIGGLLGYAAGSLREIGDSGARTWLITPTISWPLFDLARIRAGIRISEAEAELALAEYEQAVLRALAEADDAFGGYGIAQRRLAELIELAAHARRAAELANIRFEEGDTDYLGALDAARTARAAQASLVDGLVAQRIATVAVHKALGGMPAG